MDDRRRKYTVFLLEFGSSAEEFQAGMVLQQLYRLQMSDFQLRSREDRHSKQTTLTMQERREIIPFNVTVLRLLHLNNAYPIG